MHQLRLVSAADTGSLSLHLAPAPENGRHQRYRVELRAGPGGFTGTASLALDLPSIPTDPWFLIPGFIYDKGRADPTLAYPAIGPTNPNDPFISPTWDFALDRAAYPLIMVRFADRWYALDADPHYTTTDAPDTRATWGDSEPQIGLGLSWHNNAVQLRINIPANEAPIRHARNPQNHPTAKRLHLPPNASVSLHVGIWDFIAPTHGYQSVLETLYNELHPAHPPAPDHPALQLAQTAAHGLTRWHWVPPTATLPGYMVYTVAMDRSAEFNANVNRNTTLSWHFESLGFVGGFPVAFGLLWQARTYGNHEGEKIAESLIERFCREGVAPNGLFRTSYHPGRARTPNGSFPNPAGTGPANRDPSGDTPFYGSCWQGNQALAHARTTADASLYLARCMELLPPSNLNYPLARHALRASLEAALRLQLPDGRHPQIYNVLTDQPYKTDGCGGLLWIAAMHHAHDLFHDDPAFQDALRASMAMAGAGYARNVRDEYIYGAPEDVSLAPTSEDGYNAILAYGALHRRFGDKHWLDLLIQAADWTLSWRKAYNVRFPRMNIMGAHDLRTTGGDFASSNNNHLHVYGMNCLSHLYRLSHLTGNPYYAQRADDHFRFTCQMLCLEDGQWNGQRGMLTEQFYTNDWSIWGRWDPTPAHVQKGTLMGFSHVWCINMILLGLEQRQRAN